MTLSYLQGAHLKLNTQKCNVKFMKKIYQENTNQKTGKVLSISDKIDLKANELLDMRRITT